MQWHGKGTAAQHGAGHLPGTVPLVFCASPCGPGLSCLVTLSILQDFHCVPSLGGLLLLGSRQDPHPVWPHSSLSGYSLVSVDAAGCSALSERWPPTCQRGCQWVCVAVPRCASSQGPLLLCPTPVSEPYRDQRVCCLGRWVDQAISSWLQPRRLPGLKCLCGVAAFLLLQGQADGPVIQGASTIALSPVATVGVSSLGDSHGGRAIHPVLSM